MDKETAVSLFESLSSGIRLDIFRLLAPHGETGQVAGEIVAQLGLPPTNVSFHLKAMTRAGLLQVRQEGRFQRYRADMRKMQDLIAWLSLECSPAVPAAPVPAKAGKATPRKRAVAGKSPTETPRRPPAASAPGKVSKPEPVVSKPAAPNLTFDF